MAVKPTATAIQVRCVVLEGSQGAPQLVDHFELTSPCAAAADIAPMLGNLARALETRLAGIKPERIAIARANVAQIGSRHESRLRRLMVEGALGGIAHTKCADTMVDHRSDLVGRVAGGAAAAGTALRGLVHPDYAEAATAALAMLDP